MDSQDITIKITDREGVTHEVIAPTDMAMNLMEWRLLAFLMTQIG